MARAGLVDLTEASFEKDGKTIEFRRVSVSAFGDEVETLPEIQVPVEFEGAARKRGRKAKPAGSKKKSKAKKTGAAAASPARMDSRAGGEEAVEKALRAWRLGEAKSKGIPAFRILTDRALATIAERRPATARELLDVPGVGLKVAEKYGAQIFHILARTR